MTKTFKNSLRGLAGNDTYTIPEVDAGTLKVALSIDDKECRSKFLAHIHIKNTTESPASKTANPTNIFNIIAPRWPSSDHIKMKLKSAYKVSGIYGAIDKLYIAVKNECEAQRMGMKKAPNTIAEQIYTQDNGWSLSFHKGHI